MQALLCENLHMIANQTDLKLAAVVSPSGCWLMRPSSDFGYGKVTLDGRPMTAHRAAWILASGEVPPPGLFVCHTCDAPNCARNDDAGVYVVRGRELPRFGHLFLGTQLDNLHDMTDKGRRGPVPGKSKGDPHRRAQIVKRIREEYEILAQDNPPFRRLDRAALIPAEEPAPIMPARLLELPVLLKVDEVARRLGLSVVTVRAMLRRGELPTVWVGSRRRVALGDLLAYAQPQPRSESEGPEPAGARDPSPSRRPRARAPRGEFIPPTI